MLAEGNSLRATSRMADVSFNTVIKLLLDVAEKCEKYQGERVRGINAKRVQCDQTWAFIYAKQKNESAEVFLLLGRDRLPAMLALLTYGGLMALTQDTTLRNDLSRSLRRFRCLRFMCR